MNERAKRSKLEKSEQGQGRWSETKNINKKRKKEWDEEKDGSGGVTEKKRFGLCVGCLCFYVAMLAFTDATFFLFLVLLPTSI